jgi:hypothetical protein
MTNEQYMTWKCTHFMLLHVALRFHKSIIHAFKIISFGLVVKAINVTVLIKLIIINIENSNEAVWSNWWGASSRNYRLRSI